MAWLWFLLGAIVGSAATFVTAYLLARQAANERLIRESRVPPRGGSGTAPPKRSDLTMWD